MRSSEGVYFSKLDHVRGLAAYLVFVWHFHHLTRPDLYEKTAPAPFPLALLHESHTGVALFMTLSGFLFAKIVGGRELHVAPFWFNRMLRLAPLLIVSFGLAALCAKWLGSAPVTWNLLVSGLVLPTWPQGAWSIAVELHFYLLLPFLLLLARRISPIALLGTVVCTIGLRTMLWLHFGEVHVWSYWTIVGRFDQFAFGMFFALMPFGARQRAWIAALCGIAFLVFWQWFDAAGGYYDLQGQKAHSPVWIIVPTCEGLAYGALIAWYSGSAIQLPKALDAALARIGTWSYSIYLLHFYFWIVLRRLTIGTLPDLSFVPSLLLATACFVAFLPVAAASFHFFETYFLGFRVPYLSARDAMPDTASQAVSAGRAT